MFGEQGESEGGECGVEQVDDDDLGGDEESWSWWAVIVFAPAAGSGLGLGGLREDVEEELLVEARELAVGGDGEQLVGEIHEDAVVAGGVVGEGAASSLVMSEGLPAAARRWSRQASSSSRRGVVEDESAADARAERQELGRAQSLGEPRVAGEDDAEELLGIEVLAGEDAQLVEDGGEGLLRFVDDEDGPTVRSRRCGRPIGSAAP